MRQLCAFETEISVNRLNIELIRVNLKNNVFIDTKPSNIIIKLKITHKIFRFCLST